MAGVLDSARFCSLVALTGICRPHEVRALRARQPRAGDGRSRSARPRSAGGRCAALLDAATLQGDRRPDQGLRGRGRLPAEDRQRLLRAGPVRRPDGRSRWRTRPRTMCWPARSRPPVSTACGTPGSAYRCGSGRGGCGRSSNCRSNPPNCSHCEPPPTGSRTDRGGGRQCARWCTPRPVRSPSPTCRTRFCRPTPTQWSESRLTGICGTDLHAISGHLAGMPPGHGARPRIRRHGASSRGPRYAGSGSATS